MPMITAQDGTPLFVKDWGDVVSTGPTIILIHGWPLNSDSWEYQAVRLAEEGYRVISYDRRGFGRSGQPWSGYDYDMLSDDLAAVIESLGLSDVTLVGFSMAGGEILRFMNRHNGHKVARVALVSSIAPFLLKTDDNPNGAPGEVFDGMKESLRKDRQGFLQEFFKDFYGQGTEGGGVSQGQLDWSFQMAMMASPKATLDCVDAFGRPDLRGDLEFMTKPTLVIHGTADATVPIEPTAHQVVKHVEGATLKEYEGAPHGIPATHADRLFDDLLEFIKST